MAKDIIGALRVTLGFDTSDFEHGSERARETIERDTTAIKRDLSGVRTAITGFVGAFLGAEALQAAKRALDYAASIGSVASEVGVTTNQLQEYRYAASEAGVAEKDMDAALKALNKNIGEAHAGTKAQATLFHDLGVSVQDGVTKRALTAAEVLPKLADKLQGIEDPIKRARTQAKFFGEDLGPKLNGLLEQGSEGLNGLRKAAYDTGVVLSDTQIQNADKAASKLEQVKNVLSIRIAGIVADNANSVNLLAEALETAAEKAAWFFKTWKGSERIMRDESWASGFVASARKQELAGDPVTYLQMRTGELRRATAARKQIEEGGVSTRAQIQALAEARAREVEAHRLMRAAQNDTDFQRTLASERNKNAVSTFIPEGALPTPNTKPKKGPKDRTEELAQRYRDELAGLYDDQLGLERDLNTNLKERTAYEDERLLRAKDAYDADVDSRVKQGELTEEQAATLKLQRARNYDLEKQQINWALDDALLEQQTQVAQDSLDREREMLSMRAATATTAKERRALQLALLDNELESVRLAAQEVLDRHDSSDIDKDIARAKLEQLGKLRTGKTLEINRETMGPIESYMDSIPDTADEINEAYENIAANGISNMVDGLAQAGANTLKLKGLAGQLFNQLIADLIRFQAQQAVGGSGGIGSIISGIGSIFGTSNNLGGVSASSMASINSQYEALSAPSSMSFAGGGDMTVMGKRGIDRNVLSLNGMPIANVSYGERLSIANDNRSSRMPGSSLTFDMRGAVVTEDLLVQMQSIGMQSQSNAVVMMDKRNARRVRSRLGK
ncbi:hypothetical protein SAMN05518849_101538 [Sphingobium sp. AP50]|uniref:hypothetical protein n=1 Tax=Sphingobium sp. AP50 TaxID=1884369 RepID=UPI0008D78F2A|nr:hypothetical protein [Sphingobium sp. AP50]SEI68084.1 hypothetical protein SAMN05518849_101538 [Sphingobium sp. AP50]